MLITCMIAPKMITKAQAKSSALLLVHPAKKPTTSVITPRQTNGKPNRRAFRYIVFRVVIFILCVIHSFYLMQK